MEQQPFESLDGYNSQRQPSSIAAWLNAIPQSPVDQMFGLTAAYRADTHPRKVDLGVGAYRDNEAKPHILSAVKKAREILQKQADLNHEYQPIAGIREYVGASQRLLLGPNSAAIREKRVASVQTISGTGALHLGALFLSLSIPDFRTKKVHTTTPAYANHLPILNHVGLPTAQFPYYAPTTKSLDFKGMIDAISSLESGSIVLLHACAHNPTGVDPTSEQWRILAQVMKFRGLLPFFDSAYQGFATGDIDADAYSIRHFIDQNFDCILIAQSYAKNMGLYGERAGCLHVVVRDAALATRVVSQLEKLQRVEISTPPAFGARIASLILNDEALFAEWIQNLKAMAVRILQVRQLLRARLEANGTPGTWSHITDQKGMFCFSGLDEHEVRAIRRDHHVYTTPDGRFSLSGLNSQNLDYVADAVKAVTTSSSKL